MEMCQTMHRRLPSVSCIALLMCLASAQAHARGPDFDRDGFDDLAIGASFEDIGATLWQAGLVNVLYGSSMGLDDPSNRMTSIWQDQTGVEDASEAGDIFGNALAWGDFNGDCFDDLIVAARGQDVNSEVLAGALHVFYGSLAGLATNNDHVLTHASSGIPGDPGDGTLGETLVAGDFNGDGYDDVAVSSSWQNTQALIIYGGSGGLSGLNGPGAHTFPAFYAANSDSWATGDFDCDGYEDLALGEPDFTPDVLTVAAGRVDILYGTSGGLSSSGTEYFLDPAGPTQTHLFGAALAAGNFNNDSSGGHACQDLAVGIPGANDGEGAVVVLYGTSASGLQTASPAMQYITQDWGTVQGTPEAGDHFGATLAVLRADRDAYPDLVISAVGENTGEGVVHVIRGSSSGLTDTDNQLWSQSTANVPDSPEPGDRFGLVLACGDFDGEGAEDLALTVTDELTISGGTASTVNVLYLSSSSGPPTILAGEEWEQADIDVQVNEPDEHFGWSMAPPRPIGRKSPEQCLM
ncbi:FG-GAP and VCBS repeat-containing protein [Nannocystis sp. RBIL2]|uniref:FG-GAP repeat domain-containing protein n=1 Tax=Nannocystis sp. RBIL2 TaxID=2996788 RepID=UPI00226F403D|nr:FG-GAP and VCBS repeat-containing protein [Nannocystis sp. RBIL2]MCY1072059.1 FG-GAP and VCBS repeat-containing protein [Nannocystis sp. RBIL2]